MSSWPGVTTTDALEAALRARIAKLEKECKSRLCGKCLERHAFETSCPPVEARETGDAWFRQRLKEKDETIAKLTAVLDVVTKACRVTAEALEKLAEHEA